MRFQLGVVAVLAVLLSSCSHDANASTPGGDALWRPGAIRIVAAESFYGDIAAQLGGSDLDIQSVLSNPASDPHTYEPSTADAAAIASADIVIRNGLGYDAFIGKLLAASPKSGRTVIDAGELAGRHTGDNPHIWYDVKAMRTFAGALARELERRRPSRRSAIETGKAAFGRDLDAWDDATLEIKTRYSTATVATTEPVFDDVLLRGGLTIVTPPSFALAVEEGNDPAPQDVAKISSLLANHGARVLIVNKQTIEPVTTLVRDRAVAAGVPIVEITETLPRHEHFGAWMLRETQSLDRALKAAHAG